MTTKRRFIDAIKEVKLQNNKTECNHNPNDELTSLIKSPKQVLVYPPKIDFYCKECHESFKFLKGEDGNYIPLS